MQISLFRLYLLRAMYLLVSVGLILSVWPEAIASFGKSGDSYTVIDAILISVSLMALLGIRYPLKLLPILIFELLWKTIWLLGFSFPAYLNGGMDEYTAGVTFACAIGAVLTPLVMPWGYVVNEYFLSKGNRWS